MLQKPGSVAIETENTWLIKMVDLVMTQILDSGHHFLILAMWILEPGIVAIYEGYNED